MAKKKLYNDAESIFVVSEILGPEAAEKLSAILEDPCAGNEFDMAARLGKVLEDTGLHLLEQVRRRSMNNLDGGTWASNGVVLEYKNAYEQTRVNEGIVKDEYPEEDFPHLYKKVPYRETVTVKVKSLADIPVEREPTKPDAVDFFETVTEDKERRKRAEEIPF